MTRARVVLAAASALLLLTQCRRGDVPPAAAAAPTHTPTAPRPTPPGAEGATEPVDSVPPPADGWLDGNIYRVRMADVRPCPGPSDVAGATRVGVRVHVAAKGGDLLVAPRDFKLESGGVILDSAVVQKAPRACAPLLATKSLRAGKTTGGVVVFDLPPGFNAEQRPMRITYQPTRWGGARRVEALLPAGSFRL